MMLQRKIYLLKIISAMEIRYCAFLLFLILKYQFCVVSGIGNTSTDICKICKRIEECPQFGQMSREQKQQWYQNFSCKGPEAIDGIPEQAVAEGDHVCCPGDQAWDITPNFAPITKYRNGRTTGLNQNGYTNGGYPICQSQSMPSAPESGCCGVDMSDNDKLTDLEAFLQFRYPRTKREDDFKELGIALDDRIAGGKETNLNQYPWTALLSIEFSDGYKTMFFSCGGSLISSRFIVTAAHCMVNGNDQLISINATLAEYNIRTFPRDCVVGNDLKPVCIDNLEIGVEGVLIHPEFIEDFLINDIALLQLREFTSYTRSVRPICLPPINIDSPEYADLPLATAGWGLNVSVQSDVKLFTTIHLVPKSECQNYYVRLTEGHICASGKRTEDTCKGDSGGPLMMLFKGQYYLVGIVSGKTTASNCGTPVPSLYTNVYNYLNWINYFVT